MKKFFFSALICAGLAYHCLGQHSPPVKVRVLKDNTNLRAKPSLNVEVAGQASANQELTLKSFAAEWVEVVAPTNIDFWMLGDYLKDGLVVCRQAVNVRAGPGINFTVVGQMTNNAHAQVRGSHEDWIKIAPPESCSLWVSRPLVALLPVREVPIKSTPVEPLVMRPSERLTPALKEAQADVTEAIEAPKPPSEPAVFQVSKRGEERAEGDRKFASTRPPSDLDLAAHVVQGERKQYEGVLRSKIFFARSPSNFRLVVYEDGHPRTICFVKGNREQLEALLFRELIISGPQYWVKRQRYPVLIPEKIILK